MNFKKQLSYLLILLVLVLCMVNAQGDNLEDELSKFKRIYGTPGEDEETKKENVPAFTQFLSSNYDRLPADMKSVYDNLKSFLNQTDVLEDGVPMQGDFLEDVGKHVIIQVITSLVTHALG